jgi:Ca2+-binding RTX toxin-like protein
MAVYTGNSSNNFYQCGPGADQIRGRGGDDVLRGGGGGDTIRGDEGADQLFGEDGDDFLYGGADNDVLNGGADNDLIDGGTGIDWAVFDDGGPVTVNLAAGTAIGQGSDRLVSIENVRGSAFADTIIGDNGANVLAGNGGSDRLTGGGGADTFVIAPMTSGNITITDFQNGVDRLDIRAFGFDQTGYSPNWAGLLSNVPGQSDAVIEFYGVNGEFFTVTLTGLPYWQVDSSDYIF